jgi:hypothetical protein
LDFLTLDEGTDRWARNVGKDLPLVGGMITQKSAGLIYIVTEGWDHAFSRVITACKELHKETSCVYLVCVIYRVFIWNLGVYFNMKLYYYDI